MVSTTRPMTIEEFQEFALLPENSHRRLEYMDGEVFELVSSNQSSIVASRINAYLFAFVDPRELGFVTTTDGGYRVAGAALFPDCAFISKKKLPEPSKQSYYREPPDLAVEVLSPANTDTEIRRNIVNYLNAGTVVWVVEIDKRQVEVYEPGKPPKVLGINDSLDGGEVLPGFTLPIKEVVAGFK